MMRHTPARLSRRSTLPAALLAFGFTAGPALAQDAGSQPSLDQLLDLSPQSDDATADDAPSTDPDSAGDATTPGPVELDDRTRDQLTGEQAQDAFETAVADMANVSDRLSESQDPGVDTQRMQQSILDRLDQVISTAREQQQQQNSSSSGGSSSQSQSQRQPDTGGQSVAQPGQQSGQDQGQGQEQPQSGNQSSSASAGQASPGGVNQVTDETTSMEQTREAWGNLPPRLRDELSEGLAEPFSPVYQELTERYYRQLAEEQ